MTSRPTIAVWCTSSDPYVAEYLATTGFDAACIDLQHSPLTFHALPAILQALSIGGMPGLVRVPANDGWMIGKALDLGAHGVVVPMVDSAEDAQRAVAACRHPPTGRRSQGQIRHLNADASKASQCLVQIETAGAYNDLGAIVSVEGLDGILIGPGDLALALDKTTWADLDAELLREIAQAARSHHLIAGMVCSSASEVDRYVDLGFDLLLFGGDVGFMLHGAAAELAQLQRVSALYEAPTGVLRVV